MSAKAFIADVEGGVLPVDSHEKVMRIAYIYMDEGLWMGNGIFDVVEKLHAHGWSFGEGELRFNRSVDVFYLAQLTVAIYRFTNQLEGDCAVYPSPNDFHSFYTTYHALLHPSVWRSYYSPAFLTQPTTAHFYRLPNLQDLPDSDSPLCLPRQRPPAHATKLPRWAYNVGLTRQRLPSIPLETFTDIALRTLETSTARLHASHPTVVQPYSETQARFWLGYWGLEPRGPSRPCGAWEPNQFGVSVAQGGADVYAWEGKYSAQAWEASVGKSGVVEPDINDPAWKSEVSWCGWPDGGVGWEAWCRGWDGEVGGQEEVEFLAALAVEEIRGIRVDIDLVMADLDFAVRAHVLLGVMQAAVKTGPERETFLEQLEKGMVAKGRIKADRAGTWLKETLRIIKPYISIWHGLWPDGEEERGEMLQWILVENGQLFARWRVSPHLKEYTFELGPRVKE
ncbi:hypothetical protein BJY00DRAFT_321954 [Aspergillus carlsbadensis]|nr:hypothetical protein BJY00DRAFT_321954 [Aspergillus carlsbadensis]